VHDEYDGVPKHVSEGLDETMTFLAKENNTSRVLPAFVDRLMVLGQSGGTSGRWFPYMYEIIIMQWSAILREQESSRQGMSEVSDLNSGRGHPSSIAEAAARSVGVGVACAPVLFEIIKQSLGWRLHNIDEGDEQTNKKTTHLVALDLTMLSHLEQVISMVTDSCLDSRNFDSRETRQTCIDVNDSMIWFLRDLFGFLDPQSVYRLLITYLSRFAMREKMNGSDRDSMIGSRCSWEVKRLQMDAIAALIRFTDFVKVNSPQMINWGEWWVGAPLHSTTRFFDQVLENCIGFNSTTLMMTGQSGTSQSRNMMKIPTMRPHWLSELVTDVCLLGAEHVEQDIRQRSSSLLHEMFWSQSLEYTRKGNSSVVASMHISFVEKMLSRVHYLSTFAPKSQLRKDVMPCVVFVLQSAPNGLLRALWRRLFSHATSKAPHEKYAGMGTAIFGTSDANTFRDTNSGRLNAEQQNDPDIFDMFCLLNLALVTFEYEGNDEDIENDANRNDDGSLSLWKLEFLLAREHETMDVARRKKLLAYSAKMKADKSRDEPKYTTSTSRKWFSHDTNIVIVTTVQNIVRELRFVLEPSEEGRFIFNPARRKVRRSKRHQKKPSSASSDGTASEAGKEIRFSYDDTVVFVRATSSIYLQALALRTSDTVLIRTLLASIEVVKIFGIKIFNEAVGETLQHWMRLVTYHCGARRAEVRVPAADFLELILRTTWESFGSFFRIRLPLLSVQIEVMQRIVATSATRHYRDQRRVGSNVQTFSTGNAEASLAPLWRTFDRLHKQSASHNVAFRDALVRLAEKMKILFRAYIAAHSLWYLNKSQAQQQLLQAREDDDNDNEGGIDGDEDNENVSDADKWVIPESFIRASRINVHRVINASAGYSKQFLGFYSTSLDHIRVAHYEAIEDSFLDAAEVFSATELPNHRMAWLRKLAEFHAARTKFAEEATCHFHIYLTLKQASELHGALWSSTPFLPWTETSADGVQIDSEGPADDAQDYPNSFNDLSESRYGNQIDQSNSFRRIFYRVANSIGFNGGINENKNLFYGVTLPTEYNAVTPWMKAREMEANMLEEAEAAGDLFLKAGIVANSRYLWNFAVQHYAEKFNYWKLSQTYERLAQTVVSQVPPIDSSMHNEICLSVPLGRFYRVWFHGGAPDELIGAEFVYRTASTVQLDQFGDDLREIIRSIIPDKTPIHLALDGRPDEPTQQNFTGFSRMASGTAMEPVRIKVTPLRPLVVNAERIRGLPEWFNSYIDSAFAPSPIYNAMASTGSRSRNHHSGAHAAYRQKMGQQHRDHNRSFSASVFSSGPSSTAGSSLPRASNGNTTTDDRRLHTTSPSSSGDKLVGADMFSFLQPINKDRSRGSRDWLRGSSGDFAEKSLRVTHLQIKQTFPACVARQAVIHRVVHTQSPLEAGIDSLCQWCTVLFRTAIATNGQAVLGINNDPGIGAKAAKVVADSLHSSRVAEIGQTLLKKNTNVTEEVDDVLQSYERLSEDGVKWFQLKLARSVVVFIELLHLLIARNRDMLLDIIQARKKSDGSSSSKKVLKRSASRPEGAGGGGGGSSAGARGTDSISRGFRVRARSFGTVEMAQLQHDAKMPDDGTSQSTGHGIGVDDNQSNAGSTSTDKDRTDAAIALQSELQRSFISLCKGLYPMILGIMGPSDTPRWLKQCTLDNYFSSYNYLQTRLPIAEELCFFPGEDMPMASIGDRGSQPSLPTLRSQESGDGIHTPALTARSMDSRAPDSPGGSLGSGSAVSRGSDAARSTKSYKSARSMRREDRLAQF